MDKSIVPDWCSGACVSDARQPAENTHSAESAKTLLHMHRKQHATNAQPSQEGHSKRI